MGIRVRKFDQMCRQFLEQHPNGIIVSLGSGVDYRFGRIDNNQCYFVDLDFPEVLEFRKLNHSDINAEYIDWTIRFGLFVD